MVYRFRHAFSHDDAFGNRLSVAGEVFLNIVKYFPGGENNGIGYSRKTSVSVVYRGEELKIPTLPESDFLMKNENVVESETSIEQVIFSWATKKQFINWDSGSKRFYAELRFWIKTAVLWHVPVRRLLVDFRDVRRRRLSCTNYFMFFQTKHMWNFIRYLLVLGMKSLFGLFCVKKFGTKVIHISRFIIL